jgi:hypothetical protein
MITVVAAAVRWQEVIFSLPRPKRHHHIVHAMYNMGLPKEQREQGFLLSDGTFVDRLDAMKIAIEAGQLSSPSNPHYDDVINNRTRGLLPVYLYSEDLW